MILALDVGNSQIYGGVVDEAGNIIFSFRRASKTGASSDEIGIFLRSVLRENDIDPKAINQIAMCSVVPEVVHSIGSACLKYFGTNAFQLSGASKSNLIIGYKNPSEIGADRIANAIAAVHKYPDKNLIVIDLGTATTFCAISKKREYLGGSIMAGLRLNMEALVSKTAKLPSFEISKIENALGNTTIEGLQSGLYFGNLGAMKEIISRISHECFGNEAPFVIGTGGFSSLYRDAEIFDVIEPDLVFLGLVEALKLNN
ncbi:MAG: type III pantothenate kinase [Pseudomonadota bacterium]